MRGSSTKRTSFGQLPSVYADALPSDSEVSVIWFPSQALLQRSKKFVGRTYARHPRWGTYLNAAHVAAIGGEARIRAEVEPAKIDAVGELTYIQLTDSVETALTPLAGERRQRLESLMAPIILGAGRE
jgi:hypothetical protein